MINLKNIIQKMKDDGFRLTKARAAILKILAGAGSPLSFKDISRSLSANRVSADRTTVYRELRFLLEREIANTIKFSGQEVRYEIVSTHHHHLVCVSCNIIKEIILDKHLEEQEQLIFKKEKFKVASHSLEFYGMCDNCLKNLSY